MPHQRAGSWALTPDTDRDIKGYYAAMERVARYVDRPGLMRTPLAVPLCVATDDGNDGRSISK
jgi:hypothetical protein